MRPLRAAIYARVSTSNHGQDIGMQTRELWEYCERLGLEVVGEYLDSAYQAQRTPGQN